MVLVRVEANSKLAEIQRAIQKVGWLFSCSIVVRIGLTLGRFRAHRPAFQLSLVFIALAIVFIIIVLCYLLLQVLNVLSVCILVLLKRLYDLVLLVELTFCVLGYHSHCSMCLCNLVEVLGILVFELGYFFFVL